MKTKCDNPAPREERWDHVARPANYRSRSSLLRLEPHVDVLFLRVGQHLFETFLAADAGLLVAAERRAEKMLAHLVDHTKPACTAAAVRWARLRSLVQIEAVRPYSTAFTWSSILFSSDHLNTDSTGPKISSRAMRFFSVTAK